MNGAAASASTADLLATFGITQEELREGTSWKLGAVNAAIAACVYQCNLNAADVPHDGALEDALLALLRRLDGIRIERCLGLQGQHTLRHLEDVMLTSLQ